MKNLKTEVKGARQRMVELKRQAREEIATIEEAIAQRRGRVFQLCQSGVRPTDEVMADINQMLDNDRAQMLVKQWVKKVAQPRHLLPDRELGFRANTFKPHPSLRDLLDRDVNADLVGFLLRSAIRAEVKKVMDDLGKKDQLPKEAEREAEIERLTKEMKALVAERDEAVAEYANLWQEQPPDAVKRELSNREEKEREERYKAHLASLNEKANDLNEQIGTHTP